MPLKKHDRVKIKRRPKLERFLCGYITHVWDHGYLVISKKARLCGLVNNCLTCKNYINCRRCAVYTEEELELLNE